MNTEDKEYDMLRKEIELYLSKINLMTNVLYVSVTAILAWAIESQNAAMCGLAYCIIIPSYIIVQSYNWGCLKIGAYLSTFYEDYKWEKRLHSFNILTKGKIGRLSISYKLPYIFSGLLSVLSSYLIHEKNLNNDSSLYVVAYAIITILFTVLVLFQKSSDSIKQSYINGWNSIKEEET